MKLMGREISKKQIITGVSLIVAAVILILLIKNMRETASNKSDARPVNIHTVSKQAVSSTISSTGKVEAKSSETLYAKSNTTVKDVLEVGDVVLAGGEVLSFTSDTRNQLQRELKKLNVQLDASNKSLGDLKGKSSEQEILQAKAALAQIESTEEELEDSIKSQKVSISQIERELETSNDLVEKQKLLYEEDIISQQEYDELVNMNQGIKDKLEMAQIQLEGIRQSLGGLASQKVSASYNLEVANNSVTDKTKRQQIDAKEAEIKSINLQIEGLKEDIGKASTSVNTPITGIVSEVMVEKNSVVSIGSPLITILDVSELKIVSDISTFDINQVEVGQEVIVKQDNMEGTEYLAKVAEIDPAAREKQTGTSISNVVPVTIKLDEENTSLKPGFNVEVKIKTVSKEEALTVPILAILEDADEDYKYVYVVNKNDQLEKRKVIELTLDNIFIEVEGLNEGERVVAEADEDLKEGMLVTQEEPGDLD